MKVPEIITGYETKTIYDDVEKVYCHTINHNIKAIATAKGKPYKHDDFIGTIYIYRDENMVCTYLDSDLGQDGYMFKISRNVWNECPDGVNPYCIFENGFYDVYKCMDKVGVLNLLLHIPGTWTNRLFTKAMYL